MKIGVVTICLTIFFQNLAMSQSWDLTPENIDSAIVAQSPEIQKDSMRPAFHLTPPAGCMGDPNGGIFHDGWYHIFYGLQPFAHHPGAWYWAHARSKDLLHWEHMKNTLTPPLDMGIDAIGSGSTIVAKDGEKHAFYSQSRGGPMLFWHAKFTNEDLTEWSHGTKNPILTLDHSGLPPFDDFWRDPFVFSAEGRTFMIACADIFEEDYVPVPIFEAKNTELTDWEYKGLLFTWPKHKLRNLEVPEFRKIGDKWIFLASTDAPIDRCNYFIGEFDVDQLKFIPEKEGVIDYSGHYYAQETIKDEEGNLFLMAWIPGWDRGWLPTYMNKPIKNNSTLWNGCFAIPRELFLDENGDLIQKPIEKMKALRTELFEVNNLNLPVVGPTTAYKVLNDVKGNQLELELEMDIHNSSFCGLNVLCDSTGEGGLFIVWSGNKINIDGVMVPLPDWQQGDHIKLRMFIDKQLVEVFVNDGKYCVSRQVRRENIKGEHVALSSLGGTAKFISVKAWQLQTIQNDYGFIGTNEGEHRGIKP